MKGDEENEKYNPIHDTARYYSHQHHIPQTSPRIITPQPPTARNRTTGRAKHCSGYVCKDPCILGLGQ